MAASVRPVPPPLRPNLALVTYMEAYGTHPKEAAVHLPHHHDPDWVERELLDENRQIAAEVGELRRALHAVEHERDTLRLKVADLERRLSGGWWRR